ncbi:hypothetical protein SCAB_31821 [Streptomyces scabiei 87.22]|uniref:Uncharacterized protein n=1 Tax=Streptomyces scabiei (strain 87.22) TaxID=680198 RepID=C9ZDC5_STRSW|nr:hypothetical protein SCAB_31821 [Streptomyces scabiei 87.22]
MASGGDSQVPFGAEIGFSDEDLSYCVRATGLLDQEAAHRRTTLTCVACPGDGGAVAPEFLSLEDRAPAHLHHG